MNKYVYLSKKADALFMPKFPEMTYNFSILSYLTRRQKCLSVSSSFTVIIFQP